MRSVNCLLLFCAFLLIAPCQALPGSDAPQQFATLGNFTLENGATVRNCRIGYRTMGQWNKDQSNAILAPTWFTGQTQSLLSLTGPGKLLDSSRFFIILVDALGDGVSSSPSNSSEHPRLAFPRFTIRDMVKTQYRLLTEVLHVNHLRAVCGISMGGMQAFQWAVSYPGFMDKIVPIVGSPQLAPSDLLLWTAEIEAIRRDVDYKNGDYTSRPELPALTAIHFYAMTTPADRNAHVSRAQFPSFLEDAEKKMTMDPNDCLRQLQAMLSHDIAAGTTLENVAASFRTQALIVVSKQDHMVNPAPAIELGRRIHARIIEIDNACGHLGFNCEPEKALPAISSFLE